MVTEMLTGLLEWTYIKSLDGVLMLHFLFFHRNVLFLILLQLLGADLQKTTNMYNMKHVIFTIKSVIFFRLLYCQGGFSFYVKEMFCLTMGEEFIIIIICLGES